MLLHVCPLCLPVSACLCVVVVPRVCLVSIGRDEDMAGVCLFLASRAGAFVTGAVLPVDGGILVKPRL